MKASPSFVTFVSFSKTSIAAFLSCAARRAPASIVKFCLSSIKTGVALGSSASGEPTLTKAGP